jgi:hypothetical protein
LSSSREYVDIGQTGLGEWKARSVFEHIHESEEENQKAAEAYWRKQRFFYSPSNEVGVDGHVVHVRESSDEKGELGSHTSVPEGAFILNYDQANAIKRKIHEGESPAKAFVEIYGIERVSAQFCSLNGVEPEDIPVTEKAVEIASKKVEAQLENEGFEFSGTNPRQEDMVNG